MSISPSVHTDVSTSAEYATRVAEGTSVVELSVLVTSFVDTLLVACSSEVEESVVWAGVSLITDSFSGKEVFLLQPAQQIQSDKDKASISFLYILFFIIDSYLSSKVNHIKIWLYDIHQFTIKVDEREINLYFF